MYIASILIFTYSFAFHAGSLNAVQQISGNLCKTCIPCGFPECGPAYARNPTLKHAFPADSLNAVQPCPKAGANIWGLEARKGP